MKKTIKLAVVAALTLGATSAFATNGDVMIGQAAKSRSMGGVGIAKSFGAESALANPAMISSTKDMELTVSVTAFAPNVSFKAGPGLGTNATPEYEKSASDLSIIPEIYYSARLSENLVTGIAIAGTAGMGTDYDDAATAANGTFRMKTALSLAKVAVPVSYSIGNFTAGVAGVMQYGKLQLSHLYDPDLNASTQNNTLLDNGASSDVGYGVEVGVSYTTGGLTLGAVYKSKIGMTYKDTIGASIKSFGGTAYGLPASGDNLDQPEERGVGISYTMGENTISADYKNIAWGDAAGYKDFGWENQDVYAVGYEYAAKSWALRLGYNYAKSPITEFSTSASNAGYAGAVKNFFNLAGFPGVVETHYTIGGGYVITEDFTLDGAFIYVPETTNSFDTTGLSFAASGGSNSNPSSADVKHSQMGLTIAGTYKF